MEIRIIGRGALSGLIVGVFAFLFTRIFAEPLVDQAINYESGRDDAINKLSQAAGLPVQVDGPEIFSRTIQSTVGVASGVIGFSVAMGAIIAVAYVLLHGRFQVRASHLAWMIAGFGFLGVYLLPFVKYPANPPAIGHTFTIVTRGHLYLTMVAGSLILLGLAIVLARRLAPRFGLFRAILLAGAGFLAVYGVLIGVLPSFGNLSANVAHAGQFGYARASTETPHPVINVLSRSLSIDGQTFVPGQIVYPGFDADLLWKFRWYSIINQLIVWGGVALAFGSLLDRYLYTPRTQVASGGVSDAAMVG